MFKFLKRIIASNSESQPAKISMAEQHPPAAPEHPDLPKAPPGTVPFAFFATIYRKEGMYERAVHNYELSMLIDPENCSYCLEAARILLDDCHRHEQALTYLLKANAIQNRSDAQSADLQLMLAECTSFLDGVSPAQGLLQHSEALARLETLVTSSPELKLGPTMELPGGVKAFFAVGEDDELDQDRSYELSEQFIGLAFRLAGHCHLYGLNERALTVLRGLSSIHPEISGSLKKLILDCERELQG